MEFQEQFVTFMHRGEDFRPSMMMDIYGYGVMFAFCVILCFIVSLIIRKEKFNIKLWSRVALGLGVGSLILPVLIILFDNDFSKDYYSCVTDKEVVEARGNDLEIKITTCRYRIVGTNEWSNVPTVSTKVTVK